MKNSYKLALLAGLGLASVSAAQTYTTGDLLVGVYQPGVANTEVVDLGSFTSLFNGQTWDLSSALSSAGFSSTLGSTAEFGVVGYALSPSKNLYVTTSGFAPTPLNGTSVFNGDKANIASIGSAANIGIQAVGSGYDWKSETDPLGSGLGSSLGYNPDATVGNSASLWILDALNSSPTLDGTFSLNTATEVLTFNVAPVPEPTTSALLGGAGLLLLSFRKKFGRNQA